MSDLDALLGSEDEEPARGSRGRAALTTFAVAVVTGVLGLALLGLLLYGLGAGAAAAWLYWWRDFA